MYFDGAVDFLIVPSEGLYYGRGGGGEYVMLLYGPEAYLMYLTDRCRFLNCSVRMGGGRGGEGFVMNSQPTYGGGGGVGGAVGY